MVSVIIRTRGANISGFTAIGHAGFAEEGGDIVCAAVSALLQAAMAGLDEVANAKPDVTLKKGSMQLFLPTLLESGQMHDAQTILKTCLNSVEAIAKQFPGNVKVKRVAGK
ncbi:MAG: ribosomal-processing cysteine protease Prp [Oscillospiraceae bacterium]|jgi:uncharacterized protein YsxB (DUF464 family)|nr:ribosomal-processing cysteine protease Prp [Oscillospiraceae bacterium]